MLYQTGENQTQKENLKNQWRRKSSVLTEEARSMIPSLTIRDHTNKETGIRELEYCKKTG